jgi:uncharacterized protein (TIGR03086 family)
VTSSGTVSGSQGASASDQAAPAPDLRPLHERASRHFVEHVRAIAPDQWHLPSPCSDWDVRALVDHVIRWNTFVPDLLAGRSLAEMRDPLTRDVLGDDPAEAAARSTRDAVAAFEAPGALERLVHHPFGDAPGAYVLYLRLFDNTIHGWDLATALGLDNRLDDDIIAVLYAASDAQREAIRASGHFGRAEIAVPPDANLQVRLLGLLGRKA